VDIGGVQDYTEQQWGRSYLSQQAQSEYDCVDERIRMLEFDAGIRKLLWQYVKREAGL
jgi:hypothetical protein